MLGGFLPIQGRVGPYNGMTFLSRTSSYKRRVSRLAWKGKGCPLSKSLNDPGQGGVTKAGMVGLG